VYAGRTFLGKKGSSHTPLSKAFSKKNLYFRKHLDEDILFEARRTTEGKVKAYLYVSRTALEEQHSIGQNIKVELGKVGFRPFPLFFIIICSSYPRSLRRRTDRPVRRRSDRPYYSDQSPDPARSAVRRASRLPYRTPFQPPRYQP